MSRHKLERVFDAEFNLCLAFGPVTWFLKMKLWFGSVQSVWISAIFTRCIWLIEESEDFFDKSKQIKIYFVKAEYCVKKSLLNDPEKIKLFHSNDFDCISNGTKLHFYKKIRKKFFCIEYDHFVFQFLKKNMLISFVKC